MTNISYKPMWSEWRINKSNTNLVGGKDGVFATWYDEKDKLIHFASGDDGYWTEIWACTPRWGVEVVKSITASLVEAGQPVFKFK